MSNGGNQTPTQPAPEYRVFVATITGYFAVENDAGHIFVYRAGQFQFIPRSQAIAIWACRRPSNSTPAGEITALACPGLKLIDLDVRGNAALRTLDCSRNLLTELPLDGLVSLENLYFRQNPLTNVHFGGCHSLSFLRYSSSQLGRTPSPALKLHLTAFAYVSPRTRALTPQEAEIRATSYALKDGNPKAVATAAPAMAALIDGPCCLVPIPTSDCNIAPNLTLARAIAALVPGARIRIAIGRTRSVESSTERRRIGEKGLRPHEHHLVRKAGVVSPFPVYFVDNVISSGNTVRAARAALGRGIGLAYADAGSILNDRPRKVRSPRNNKTKPAAQESPAIFI